jgi:hypothetical protein
MKNDYQIEGDITRIFLNRKDGSTIETRISTSDLPKVKEFPNTWCASWQENTRSFYVLGHAPVKDNKRKRISLQRWIFNEPEGLVIDHINHDTLNNTRENLRAITNAQNQQNRKGAPISSGSGIRGVYWYKRDKKWKVKITLNNKGIDMGNFNDIKEAEKAAILARSKYMNYSEEGHRGTSPF